MRDLTRQVVKLPCEHTFHIGCIASTLIRNMQLQPNGQRRGSCPFCRRPSLTEECTFTVQWQQIVGALPPLPPPPPQEPQVQIAPLEPLEEMQPQQRRRQIAAIVCSRRNNQGNGRELRIHWHRAPYRNDTWEPEPHIRDQAPLIYALWHQRHDNGETPSHDYAFPLRPAPWMTTIRAGRDLPQVEYAHSTARRRLFQEANGANERQAAQEAVDADIEILEEIVVNPQEQPENELENNGIEILDLVQQQQQQQQQAAEAEQPADGHGRQRHKRGKNFCGAERRRRRFNRRAQN